MNIINNNKYWYLYPYCHDYIENKDNIIININDISKKEEVYIVSSKNRKKIIEEKPKINQSTCASIDLFS